MNGDASDPKVSTGPQISESILNVSLRIFTSSNQLIDIQVHGSCRRSLGNTPSIQMRRMMGVRFSYVPSRCFLRSDHSICKMRKRTLYDSVLSHVWKEEILNRNIVSCLANTQCPTSCIIKSVS